MLPKKKEHPKEKSKLHPRNKHRERYDFKQLIESCPELAAFVKMNIYNDESIDFADPDAVKMLNKTLLKHYYNIDNWNIPENYLCPPIPGRADYIHYMADLLYSSNFGKMPAGKKIKCLDVGVGANCVYPIIGNKEYDWSFVGSDIDAVAVESAKKIIESNPVLKNKIEIRLQKNLKDIFYGIIQQDEYFDLTVCNPPFHKSLIEASEGTLRKLNNLNDKKITKPVLNFGGKSNELWCKGGEVKFVKNMIYQSKQFATSCFWFSTLIAKQTHLSSVYEALKKVEATEVKTIPMGQGNKSSRIVAWTFFTPEQKKNWANTRWNK
ncbi:MAG TPA: 23S rRNA (adenine(1618)-N(6))-methyltransferase RlmF [Bacteroidales bacterium]|mgnify:CR=1 FL=1|nr:23S rRNA (adenine(1618)-N(6))-methyltransferase RlmF [Bacteroidales bacterium]HPS18076.1 23S rRNA (adenine(1618)-N(6))-methyltransferase RlmF [Bacteroidales bacterium]